jgi:hypothetical protein
LFRLGLSFLIINDEIMAIFNERIGWGLSCSSKIPYGLPTVSEIIYQLQWRLWVQHVQKQAERGLFYWPNHTVKTHCPTGRRMRKYGWAWWLLKIFRQINPMNDLEGWPWWMIHKDV